jgi:hypothetical protein
VKNEPSVPRTRTYVVSVVASGGAGTGVRLARVHVDVPFDDRDHIDSSCACGGCCGGAQERERGTDEEAGSKHHCLSFA